MHILVFYQHYNNPDCPSTGRLYSFLQHWAPRHEVTLLATRARYDTRLSDDFPWVPPGVRVHLLDVPYDNTMGAGQRLRAFGTYAVKAILKGLAAPRPDVILGISTPLTAAAAAAAVAWLRGVPWVFIIQDLWPDFPIQMGALPSPLLQRPLYALERALYRSAAHLVPFSPDMAVHLARHGVPAEKITMQFNGTDFWLLDATTDAEIAALRRAHGLEGKRVVLYAGTFGRANALPTLLAAAEALRPHDDVRFVFVGYGYHDGAVREAAARQGNVVQVAPQPRHRMFAWFRLADVSIVSFIDRPVLATNSPAKLYDSLGAGTPVIVTNPGWTRRLVEAHGCGWYVPPEDAGALAQRLEACLADPDALAAAGRRGAALARQQFDRATLAAEMEEILERVARR